MSISLDKDGVAQKVLLFRLFYNCQLMYDYLSAIGKVIPGEVVSDLTDINSKTHDLLKEFNARKAPRKDRRQVDFEYQSKIASELKPYASKLSGHFNTLVKLCKPATPCTLENTIPRWKIFGFFGQKCAPFAAYMYWNGIIYLVGYILTVSLLLPAMLSDLGIYFLTFHLNAQVTLFFSAGLGGSLYALITSRKYLLNRTFDNKYIPHYINRILVGIMTGFILAQLIAPEALTETAILSRLTPSMIALLGGFSADAVIKIMNRIVAMLTALFEGDAKEIAENTKNAIKARINSERIKHNLAYVLELQTKLHTSGLNKQTSGFKDLEAAINKIKLDGDTAEEESGA